MKLKDPFEKYCIITVLYRINNVITTSPFKVSKFEILKLKTKTAIIAHTVITVQYLHH